jgi:hypothetical protein
MKEKLLQALREQDWQEIVIKRGATSIEEASVCYAKLSLGKFSALSRKQVKEMLEGSEFVLLDGQEVGNENAPVIEIEEK